MEAWRHYERAIDAYLRSRGVAFVGVEQARMMLCPPLRDRQDGIDERDLKFFDFVVYAKPTNLLVEVKGRRIASFSRKGGEMERASRPAARMECWVTRDDVSSLTRWQQLFGPAFEAVLVFVYWCEDEPPSALFQQVFEFERRWYALRSIRLCDYVGAMKVRSERWRTLDLRQADFERLSEPFTTGGEGDEVGDEASNGSVKDVSVSLESWTKGHSLPALASPAAPLPNLAAALEK